MTLQKIMSKSVNDILTKNEIQSLLPVSNIRGLSALLTTWGLIAICFGAVAYYPSIWTMIPAMILIGGRQLALAILMHEASHNTLFSSKKINDFVGQWFCALPLWLDVSGYRKHHLQHHKYTWTDQDPDLGLSKPYPVSRKSMLRKWLRDLTGLTSLKSIYGYLLRDFGFIEFTISTKITSIAQTNRTKMNVVLTGMKNLAPFLLVHSILFSVFLILEKPWVYLLWWASFMTFFHLFIRLRAIAEHSVIGNPEDDFENTRTTRANLIARLLVAPHNVNYHLEHHLLMTVPHDKLPAMHRIISDRNVFNEGNSANGYWEVFRKATRPVSS